MYFATVRRDACTDSKYQALFSADKKEPGVDVLHTITASIISAFLSMSPQAHQAAKGSERACNIVCSKVHGNSKKVTY